MVTARWWHRFRVARRTAIGLTTLAALAGVCAYGAAWRASSIINRLLRDWAVGVVAQESGDVYRLDFGHVRFDWELRRVAVDSISVTTRRAVNGRRPQLLPGLTLALYSCALSGVHFVTLIRNAGLVASSFGCRTGTLMVEVPRGQPAEPGLTTVTPALGFGRRPTFLVFQQAVRLPSYAPHIRIARVVFPRLALDVRIPRTTTNATTLLLERLQWHMTDLAIDPADTLAAARPLFSRTVELVATDFVTRPDSATAVRVGLLRTNLTDSTLEIRDVSYLPTVTGSAFTQLQPFRRDLIRLNVGRITAQGIDMGAFIVGEGVRARRIDVDSMRIDVRTDKRQPKGKGRLHRTPQQWIADLDETLALDSLWVRNSQVIYREHAPGRERSGVFTFARIVATATNVKHFVGRHTSDDPMTLNARAYVQGMGQLDVRVVVPLDAPRFDLTYRGTLGPMSAAVLNPFVVETAALQIENGLVERVDFDVVVKKGSAKGAIIPRFNDLQISVTREGSGGILGGGGIFSGAARSVASFVAARRVVRANNPEGPARPPHIGPIDHTFSPDESLVAFLWSGVRDGLLSVVKK